MARRHLLAGAGFAFVALGVACVDLFHSTDFETLCSRSPSDPQCASADAAPLSDVVVVDAKKDASRPHPDFCAWSSTEARTQALHACAWLGACEGPLGESVFGPCVVRAQLAFDCGANPSLRPAGAADAFWSCLATVSSCSEVDDCVFPAGPQGCKGVDAGSFTACATLGANKSVRVKCGTTTAGPAVGVEPCVMLGKTCSPEDDSVAACSGTLGYDTCSTNLCSGTGAVDCNPSGARTFDRGVDCTLEGAGQCAPGDSGPACAPSGATTSCTEDTLPTCSGTVVTSCIGSKEISIDCNRLGLPCDDSVSVPAYDPTAACIRRQGVDTCVDADKCVSGRVLQSCGRGALYEIDCTTIGLGACAVDAAGHAACGRVP